MPATPHRSAASRAVPGSVLRQAVTSTIATVIFALAAPAFATQVVLDAVQTGLYSSRGGFDSTSYATGITSSVGSETRGFLVFDLSPLARSGRVVSATLLVQNKEWSNQHHAPMEVRLYGLPNTGAENFGRNEGADRNIRNFAFIGSDRSTLFARSYSMPGNSTFGAEDVSLSINEAGLIDLNENRADTYYVYGLKIVKADREEPKPLQFVFGGAKAGANRVQLVLEVNHQAP